MLMASSIAPPPNNYFVASYLSRASHLLFRTDLLHCSHGKRLWSGLPGRAGARCRRGEVVASHASRSASQRAAALSGFSTSAAGIGPEHAVGAAEVARSAERPRQPALRESPPAAGVFLDRKRQGARPGAQGAPRLGRAIRGIIEPGVD